MLANNTIRERASAPVETVFAIVMLMVLALSAIEIAFVLYGRNVVMASAHEGARVAVELGGSASEAEALARATAARSAGDLIGDLQVEVRSARSATATVVKVRVAGRLKAIGPVPIPLRVTATATATREIGNP